MLSCADQRKLNSNVIDDDIVNFWEAYDAITSTQDSVLQSQLLDSLYIQPGTAGLKAFMERKGYTPERYLHAINTYPKFWASIRKNSFRSKAFREEIEVEITKLKAIYPDLKAAKIYFTIGALMSPGTTMDSLVLIGAELALADSNAVTDELPDWLAENLRRYFDSNPIQDVVLLNVHEYVHTQQNTHGYDLLSQSLHVSPRPKGQG